MATMALNVACAHDRTHSKFDQREPGSFECQGVGFPSVRCYNELKTAALLLKQASVCLQVALESPSCPLRTWALIATHQPVLFHVADTPAPRTGYHFQAPCRSCQGGPNAHAQSFAEILLSTRCLPCLPLSPAALPRLDSALPISTKAHLRGALQLQPAHAAPDRGRILSRSPAPDLKSYRASRCSHLP